MAEQQSDDRDETLTRAMVEVLDARFPGRFDAEGLDQVRRQIADLNRMANRLRAFPLTNADEPDPIFRAYRREG